MAALGPSRRRAVPVPLIGADACGLRFARAGCPAPAEGGHPPPDASCHAVCPSPPTLCLVWMVRRGCPVLAGRPRRRAVGGPRRRCGGGGAFPWNTSLEVSAGGRGWATRRGSPAGGMPPTRQGRGCGAASGAAGGPRRRRPTGSAVGRTAPARGGGWRAPGAGRGTAVPRRASLACGRASRLGGSATSGVRSGI
ncbi:hypothetical protein BU14_0475s0004 [Porphyra umbilicalis]|uniref:Uncharacterized protein n=1 Tax=Porphyra umbilicalis TaxID=2786 RepID=A0A1X6NTW7_PORUM|nr:hypothetical protein BU14_0475s0004 [Porphyra umbilicalis]|eukprot:OSX72052.1 hypothetical protein BU14_0475s0004 [Porphyra umbilicalis]